MNVERRFKTVVRKDQVNGGSELVVTYFGTPSIKKVNPERDIFTAVDYDPLKSAHRYIEQKIKGGFIEVKTQIADEAGGPRQKAINLHEINDRLVSLALRCRLFYGAKESMMAFYNAEGKLDYFELSLSENTNRRQVINIYPHDKTPGIVHVSPGEKLATLEDEKTFKLGQEMPFAGRTMRLTIDDKSDVIGFYFTKPKKMRGGSYLEFFRSLHPEKARERLKGENWSQALTELFPSRRK